MSALKNGDLSALLACWRSRCSIRLRSDPGQHEGKKETQLSQDLLEIVAGGSQQHIDGIAFGAEQVGPVQAPVRLHVGDRGLDR